MTVLATALCALGILGFLWLDREAKTGPSFAMWIVFIWFFLACSRPVARWMGIDDVEGSATAVLSEGSPIDRAVWTALLIAGLAVLLKRSRRSGRSLWQNWPVALFFVYCLCSVAWSDFPMVAFKRWIKAIGDLVVVLILWTESQPFEAMKWLLVRCAYSLVPLSILLIKYYPRLGRVYGTFFGEVSYTGVAGDKNGLGAVCMLFGIFVVWRILNLFTTERRVEHRSQRLLAQFAVLAMMGWLLSLADSMTSLSCFLLGVCTLVCMRFRLLARRQVMVHVLALTIVFIPTAVTLLGASPEALQAMGRNPTLTDRTLIWSAVVKLVPNAWVGSGYGSFWLGPRLEKMIVDVTHHWVPNQAHSGYLEVYANLGWIGVVLLAIAILWGYFRVIRACGQNNPIGHLLLAYFVVGVVSNITEASFFRMAIPAWLFFLLAVSAPKLARRRLQKPLASPSRAIEATPKLVFPDDVLEAIR